MATAEIVTDRVDIRRVVRVTFAEDERPEIQGDRKRGSSNRRPARVVSIRLGYWWSIATQEWLTEYGAMGMVEQQKADGTWSAPSTRSVTGIKEFNELRDEYRPTTIIKFEEVSA